MAKTSSKKARGPGRRSVDRGRAITKPQTTATRHPAPDDSAPPQAASAEFAVAGVGASAGGLEAFAAVLRALPPDPGVALVFVQHLAPQHESALVELLSAHTRLPVVQIAEGQLVKRNHVYVIPPNSQLLISEFALHLGPRPTDRSQYTPVDAFLTSLARSAGPRSIGIILSGTASDGAVGIGEIKAAGGITIAQTPETAKYDGMPRAAIATGTVDLVLSPHDIGAKLAQLAAMATTAPPSTPSPADFSPTDGQLDEIFDLLRPHSGVDFRHYKLPTIKRRVFRRMTLHRLTDIDDYIGVLRADSAEVRNLYRDLLIHVTRFFREPESFDAIARDVFPALLAQRPRDQPIRVWVSACATGEEAYSLAIALVDFMARQQADYKVQINLLSSVQIAIVIVGPDMHIRRFTPMAERVLNLIPGDVGRSIGHINPNIEGADLEGLIAEAIDSISLVEREVQDRQGRWYGLRIRPYRSLDNKIDGAVLALFDIDAPKRYEASVRSATALAEAILHAAPQAMALLDSTGRIRKANAKFAKLLQLGDGGLEGRLLSEAVQLVSGFEQLRDGHRVQPPSRLLDLTVRPAHLQTPVALSAQVFSESDGSAGRLVLLTARTSGGEATGVS